MFSSTRLARLRAGLIGATMLATPFAALAATPQGSFVPFDNATAVHGAAPASAIVHFQVSLRMRDASGLQAAIAAHKVLTPAQLEAYLPDVAGHQAVLGWLREQGLTIESVPGSRLAIDVSGRADLVGRLLQVGFVRVTSEGAEYVSADREPAIPAVIAPHVLGVIGLQPHNHLYPQIAKIMAASPRTVTGGKPPLYPIDLLTAYQATGLGTGAGTTTAIVINTFPYTADLTNFWATTGVSQSLANISFIQVVSGTLPKPGGEESLDVEQSSSMAPASHVNVYATKDLSNAHLDTAYQRIISDMQAGVRITQVSMSYGGCETSQSSAQKTTDDQYYATMTALGATVMASSGDSGARECTIIPGYTFTGPTTPSFPSTSPNLASIGGTSLKLTSSSTISTETGWSGSGGGVSKFYATPSWQQSLGYSKRANPDVSADADPNTGVYIVYAGKTGQVGGTSVSSPVIAGLMGLVNAQRISLGKPTLGLLPARTTQLLGSGNFRDITSGSNHGYTAKIGYDLVTGVGTPVMSVLSPTLVAQP